MSAGIDIGLCIVERDSGQIPVSCLWKDGRNYCCHRAIFVSSNDDQDICCTYEEYADQHWVSLAIIQGYEMFLIFFFLCSLGWLGWFYVSSFMIKEKDVKDSRRRIVKHLIKSQILHKSRIAEPSAIGSMDRIKKKFTSSGLEGKKKKANKRKRKSDDKNVAIVSGAPESAANKRSPIRDGIKSLRISWYDLGQK